MPRIPRLFLLLLTLAVPGAPALCQQGAAPPADLRPLLSGTSGVPLTVKLGDLTGDWQRLSVGQPVDLSSVTRFYTSFLTGGPGDVYYTQGRTVAIGADQYLVAYHAPSKPLDLQALSKLGDSSGGLPKPTPLTADTVLSLSLLNLHNVSNLSDIRPFDMQQEIAAGNAPGLLAGVFGQAQGSAQAASADSDLKQIGLGLLEYTQDNDEKLPPMPSAAAVKKVLSPYVKDDAVFVDPATKQPFLPNTSLSRRSIATFAAPASMVIYYQAAPAPDGTRGVLFLDGHVKRVPETDWPALRAASHVPNAAASVRRLPRSYRARRYSLGCPDGGQRCPRNEAGVGAFRFPPPPRAGKGRRAGIIAPYVPYSCRGR